MRRVGVGLSLATIILLGTGPTHAAVQYPLALTLDAQMKTGETTVTSKVTVRVDRAMDDSRRTRVTDALKFGGYANFLNALRPSPPLGTIAVRSATVEVRYTREEQEGTATRLVLIADRPLFFLSPDPDKAKSAFQLTVIELQLDGKGGVTGRMAGAARVRPAPDGGVLLDDFAESLVQLSGQIGTR